MVENGDILEETAEFPDEMTEEKDDFSEVVHQSIYQQALRMSVSQKIQLALKGNKEARNILIKDANKLVSTAVIKSPRITENEVAMYAKSRSISDDVLRLIAANKDWTKNREVFTALVNNPRTPLALSLKFMTRLNDKQMADLSKNKGIPAALASAARRLMAQKKDKGK